MDRLDARTVVGGIGGPAATRQAPADRRRLGSVGSGAVCWSGQLGLNEAFDRVGCAALEVVEPKLDTERKAARPAPQGVVDTRAELSSFSDRLSTASCGWDG
jgi:hypothetical protein